MLALNAMLYLFCFALGLSSLFASSLRIYDTVWPMCGRTALGTAIPCMCPSGKWSSTSPYSSASTVVASKHARCYAAHFHLSLHFCRTELF